MPIVKRPVGGKMENLLRPQRVKRRIFQHHLGVPPPRDPPNRPQRNNFLLGSG